MIPSVSTVAELEIDCMRAAMQKVFFGLRYTKKKRQELMLLPLYKCKVFLTD
jgi:hypothetical protein